MAAVKVWIYQHRRLVILKCVIAVLLVVAHFFPQTIPHLAVSLVWLFVF